MNMKKILSVLMALVLALGCFAALAEEDLQAQLDAANARIDELQALVDAYYPYYEAQLVATYGEDGKIMLADVSAEYEALASQYASMGLDLVAYGMDSFVKKDIVDTAVKDAVQLIKAAELGLDQLSEENTALVESEADALFNGYLDSYIGYYYPDMEVTEEMTAEAEDYWALNGVTRDSCHASVHESAVLTAVHEHVIKDVEVTDADIEATYQTMIEENKADYTSDSAYNSDRNSGVAMAWQPEGYRAVTHILIGFDDEQSARYADLQSQLNSLNAEKEAIETPVEPAEGEEAAEPRSVEEIDADIAACAAEVESLYAALLPTAEEAIAAFNDGTPFEELIAKYNTDPGMQNEPTASNGYAVAANSTTWDPAFTAGAMSIENIGGISEPVYGSYGIHIIYYKNDIPAGEVALEEILEDVKTRTAETKIQETYNAQVSAWLEEMNVTYYYDNFGIVE